MIRTFTCSVLLVMLCGCVATTTSRGYNSDKLQLSEDAIKPGLANVNTVRNVLGSPSATSSFGDPTWYYISSKTKTVAFLKPKVVEQNVIAVAFDDKGTVKSVHKYDRDDMREFALRKDYTNTEGHDLTVLQQLLGNVGRFNPAEGGMPGAPSTIGTGQ